MTRNVPLARKKRSDKLPVCPFPRGKKAGIRCVTLKVLTVGGRTIKLCDEMTCTYNEKTEAHELGLKYVGVEL